MEELISIVVPVYNAQSTLERCLNSILHQNYKEIELICIDDGSKDNSLDVLKKFEEFDKRVKVIARTNKGVSVARNEGIRVSKGQYILFVDSDDFIEENMVFDLYQAIKKADADIAIEGYREINQDGVFEVYDYKDCVKKEEFLLRCIQNTGGVVCSKLYRSSLIKRNELFFRKDLSLSEDLIFALECIKKANGVIQIKKADYVYDRRNEVYKKIEIIERLKKNIVIHDLIIELLDDQKIEEKNEILKKRLTSIMYVNLLDLVKRSEIENFKKVSVFFHQYDKQLSWEGYDFLSKMWLKAYEKNMLRSSYLICRFRIKLAEIKRRVKS